MAYRIRQHEEVEAAVRRIAVEQLEGALADIDGASRDVETAVHEVRKRCKKTRGLLRLVRPWLGRVYREENACLRDTARRLSAMRDHQVMIHTFDGVCTRCAEECATRRFAAIRSQLVAAAPGSATDPESVLAQLAQVRPALERACERAAEWRVPARDFAAVEPGLRRSYRRGRRAMAAAAEHAAPARVHEWRKRAKYHWYHARLLAGCWRPVMDAWRGEAHRLAEGLGDVHDLQVLRRHLAHEAGMPQADGDLQALLALLDRHQRERLAHALRRGRRLYAEKPRRLTARFERYWRSWRGAGATGSG